MKVLILSEGVLDETRSNGGSVLVEEYREINSDWAEQNKVLIGG